MSEIVTYATSDRVAIITLNRPEARNAVNGDLATGLEHSSRSARRTGRRAEVQSAVETVIKRALMPARS